MTDYNDGEWHGWNGGDCPVHPDTVVVACFQTQTGSTRMASEFNWSSGLLAPITSFRVTKPYVEPKVAREFWLVDTGGGFLTVNHAGSGGGIHVREVLDDE